MSTNDIPIGQSLFLIDQDEETEENKATIDEFWESVHVHNQNSNLKMSLNFVEQFRPLDKTYAWVRVNKYGLKDCGNIEEIDFHRFMELAQKGYSPVDYEYHRVLLQNFNNVTLNPHMGVICDGMWLLEGPKELEPVKKKDNFVKVFINKVGIYFVNIFKKIKITCKVWRNDVDWIYYQ